MSIKITPGYSTPVTNSPVEVGTQHPPRPISSVFKIEDPKEGDIITFQDQAWKNKPREVLADGGNF